MRIRILFSSFHNYLDQTSGAAVSTRSVLRALARRGHDVRVFCGTFFDTDADEEYFLNNIKRLGVPVKIGEYKVRFQDADVTFRQASYEDSGISCKIFIARDAFKLGLERYCLSAQSGDLFYRLLEEELNGFRPDYFTTYGGDSRLRDAARNAKALGSSTVFFLHNLTYPESVHFEPFDTVVVPSRFAKEHYRDKLGLDCRVIPPLIEEESVRVDNNSRKFLTFINPALEKGLTFFVGIAKELGRIRPELPILVVNSRSKAENVRYFDASRQLKNVYVMPTTCEPRRIYAQTRLLLVPSLCEESFGRVPVEAAFNGIPALCSNRGALAEVLGEPRLTLDIPKRFTPNGFVLPNEQETRSWVDTILAIWDDEKLEQELGAVVRETAKRYSQSVVEEELFQFFEKERSR